MNEFASDQAVLHFMVALPCEAKPLIQHYQLSRRMDETVFPIYQNSSITLTVTGVGKTAMAAGTAYTYAVFGRLRMGIWMNIGVAGHPEFPIGQPCLVHKVTDWDGDRSWYPPLLSKLPCDTESLITVSRPETVYRQTALYDMEGSGFYGTACRFTTSELVQCFKIVSDNRHFTAESVRAGYVAELVENRIDLIERLVGRQRQLATDLDVPRSEIFEQFTRRWRFSVQQTVQLESLLHRWTLLDPESCPKPEQLDRFDDGRQVLGYLRGKVDRLAMVFS